MKAFLLVGLFSPSVIAATGKSGKSNGEEKGGKTEGDAGPSCSSASSKTSGDSKSRFFDDSEESEEGEEEDGSDEEVRAADENRFSLWKFPLLDC